MKDSSARIAADILIAFVSSPHINMGGDAKGRATLLAEAFTIIHQAVDQVNQKVSDEPS